MADDHDVDVRLLLLAVGWLALPLRERAIVMSEAAMVMITYPILAVVLRCCGKVEQATCA